MRCAKQFIFFQSDEKGLSPKTVILAGGSSGLPESASTITRLLGLEVVVGNPFAKIVVDAKAAKTLAIYAPLYSVAVGLALRGD